MRRSKEPRPALVLGTVGVRLRAGRAARDPLGDETATIETGVPHAGRFETFFGTGTDLEPAPVGAGIFGTTTPLQLSVDAQEGPSRKRPHLHDSRRLAHRRLLCFVALALAASSIAWCWRSNRSSSSAS
jgi:hypothetical protein